MSYFDDTDDADRTVGRRTVLKSTAALGATGLAGLVGYGSVGAQSTGDALVVDDFEGDDFPGENALGNWATVHGFEEATVDDGVLTLAYDDGGFLASRVSRDVSDHSHLVLGVRGAAGGEEEDVQIEVGSVEGALSSLSSDSIGTDFSTVAVDLESMGVDRASVDDVRLNFWQGGASAVEVAWIAFAPSADPGLSLPGGGSTPTGPGATPTPEPEAFPWEVEAGNEKEPDNPIPVEEIDESTTLKELCPTFDSSDAHMHVPRTFVDYLPDRGSDPGEVDWSTTNLSDAEKAALFDVDVEAIQSKVQSGEVTLGEMGTQAVDHVTTAIENGLPHHAAAKLLPRLMLLPDETVNQPYHKGGDPWAETAGPQAANGAPDRFVQHEWPTDARTYIAEEKYERDRAHDQPDHEDGWTNGTPGEEVYADEDHPLLETIRTNTHPVTGEDLGEGFTANAPVEARVKIHSENDNYLYHVLDFKNTQPVPYYIDAAIIWWVGPAGLSTLRNGHYNNAHRPNPGKGHPQRDIIEVIYDRERSLSAYAVRIAQHDEPYNMRTAYPNQWWGLEQGVPATDPINGGERFTSSEERQAVVDTMMDTLHVEFESNLDRNHELHDALQLRNRVSN